MLDNIIMFSMACVRPDKVKPPNVVLSIVTDREFALRKEARIQPPGEFGCLS